MYKKLTYEQLLQLKSSFFDTLSYILKKNKYPTLKDYLTVTSRQWTAVYHMMRQDYIWRTVFVDGLNEVVFFDEREKIELHADKSIIAKIWTLVRDTKKMAAQSRQSESIEETLTKAFERWDLSTINGKNYLVYDIETSYANNDLRTLEFYIWSAYVVEWWKWSYRSIDKTNLVKFLEFMLDFDGYIIGFNSLAFDNPVTVYNALASLWSIVDESEYEHKLEILHQKSLDIFQFVQNLTKVRMWLNRLSRALVWVWKTLESGKEWENLWKQYQEWDEKSLKILKDYCKNDVKMTYLSLRYILYYKKLSLNDTDIVYTIDDFVRLSNIQAVEEDLVVNSKDTANMFS